MRQMEFDADRFEAEVAGSAQFALTFERLNELNVGFELIFSAVLRGELEVDSELEFAEQVADPPTDLRKRPAPRGQAPGAATGEMVRLASQPNRTDRSRGATTTAGNLPA